jgi:hypothetical protein
MRTWKVWISIAALAVGVAACGDDDAPAADVASDDGFCARAGELADQIEAAVEASEGDLSGDAVLEQLQAQIAMLERLEAAAPSEIQADVERLVELSTETVAILQDDDEDEDQDELSHLDAIDEEADELRANVGDFVRDECGIELNPAAGDADDTTDADSDDDTEDVALPEPPDPCGLAGADEIGTIIGTPVESTDFTGDGTIGDVRSLSCTLNAQTDDGLLTVSISTLTFPNAEDVRAEYEGFGDVTDAAIEGLPASTFRTSVNGLVTIWVVDAATPYGVAVSVTADGEIVDRTPEAEALAVALYEPE